MKKVFALQQSQRFETLTVFGNFLTELESYRANSLVNSLVFNRGTWFRESCRIASGAKQCCISQLGLYFLKKCENLKTLKKLFLSFHLSFFQLFVVYV